jgi:hypothetical protein
VEGRVSPSLLQFRLHSVEQVLRHEWLVSPVDYNPLLSRLVLPASGLVVFAVPDSPTQVSLVPKDAVQRCLRPEPTACGGNAPSIQLLSYGKECTSSAIVGHEASYTLS